jgi:hypothetical protein
MFTYICHHHILSEILEIRCLGSVWLLSGCNLACCCCAAALGDASKVDAANLAGKKSKGNWRSSSFSSGACGNEAAARKLGVTYICYHRILSEISEIWWLGSVWLLPAMQHAVSVLPPKVRQKSMWQVWQEKTKETGVAVLFSVASHGNQAAAKKRGATEAVVRRTVARNPTGS